MWIYVAEELKLPYLSAYLDSVGSNYRHGANFAVGGSSIRPGGYSPFPLGLQVDQFLQFKSRTNILFNQLSDNSLFLFTLNFLSFDVILSPCLTNIHIYCFQVQTRIVNIMKHSQNLTHQQKPYFTWITQHHQSQLKTIYLEILFTEKSLLKFSSNGSYCSSLRILPYNLFLTSFLQLVS